MPAQDREFDLAGAMRLLRYEMTIASPPLSDKLAATPLYGSRIFLSKSGGGVDGDSEHSAKFFS